jgi:hypothetical protein
MSGLPETEWQDDRVVASGGVVFPLYLKRNVRFLGERYPGRKTVTGRGSNNYVSHDWQHMVVHSNKCSSSCFSTMSSFDHAYGP